MKRTVFDDQLAHRLGGHKGRLHRNSSPRLCLHWQTTSPSSSLQRNETRVELSIRQKRIVMLRFVSQSPSHCRTWWAASKILVSQDLPGSLWHTLALSDSLWLTLSLSLSLIPAHSCSRWLSPAHCGSLKRSLAHELLARLASLWLCSTSLSIPNLQNMAPIRKGKILGNTHLIYYC